MTKSLVLFAAVAAASVASAQTPLNPIGLSARIGVFYPTNDTLKDVSKTWFAAGVQYKVSDLYRQRGLSPYSASFDLSLDYMQRDDIRLLPLMANYVGNINSSLFFTGGLGVVFVDTPNSFGDDNETRFGYTLGVGYNFRLGTVPVFAEGRFWGNEEPDYNGFGLYVGLRF
jgi:hypothetical protein